MCRCVHSVLNVFNLHLFITTELSSSHLNHLQLHISRPRRFFPPRADLWFGKNRKDTCIHSQESFMSVVQTVKQFIFIGLFWVKSYMFTAVQLTDGIQQHSTVQAHFQGKGAFKKHWKILIQALKQHQQCIQQVILHYLTTENPSKTVNLYIFLK